MYESMGGQDLVRILNEQNMTVKVVKEEEGEIYGDGQVGWSYFDVKPDPDIYGTLGELEIKQGGSQRGIALTLHFPTADVVLS